MCVDSLTPPDLSLTLGHEHTVSPLLDLSVSSLIYLILHDSTSRAAASEVQNDGRKGTSSISKVKKQDTQLRVTSTSDLVPQQQDPISTHVTLSTNTRVTPSATTSAPISTPQIAPPITTPQVTLTTPVTPPNYTNNLGLDDQHVPQPPSPPSTQSHPTSSPTAPDGWRTGSSGKVCVCVCACVRE